MIEYLVYGVLLSIGYHIGGKVAKKYNLGPKKEKKVKFYKAAGRNTKEYLTKIKPEYFGG